MITLTSIQWQNGERSQTELVTRANFSKSGRTNIISYKDTEDTGFDGSVTTIRINNGKSASIIRKGTANSALFLEIGKKHFCQYGTPYGTLQLGIYTHEIRNTIASNGSIYMKYTLDLNASHLSDNEIIITIN